MARLTAACICAVLLCTAAASTFAQSPPPQSLPPPNLNGDGGKFVEFNSTAYKCAAVCIRMVAWEGRR